MKRTYYYKSPIGILKLVCLAETLVSICFVEKNEKKSTESTDIILTCRDQLDKYFRGKLKEFDIPLAFGTGTKFQKSVWKALQDIPYGETRSYQDIAMQIGNPKAVKAVGGANNKNPLGIVVPCHRVIGKNGKLVGYAGGLEKKDMLLELEKGKK